jgi:hypothetical protein
MSLHWHHGTNSDERRKNASYDKGLWNVLAINAAMFLVEVGLRRQHGFVAGGRARFAARVGTRSASRQCLEPRA